MPREFDQIVRCETPLLEELKLDNSSVKVDEKTGDVTFDAIALDTKKQPNRKGFVFKWKTPTDVDISSLQANGRLYFMHDTFEIGIGFIMQVKVSKNRVTIKGLIPGDSRFPENMQDSDLVKRIRDIRQSVEMGLLKAVSIGFYINEWQEITNPKDPSDVTGILVTKLEIIEVSVVTIGAHETALIQDVGIVCEDELEWAEEQFESTEPDILNEGPRECYAGYTRQGELVTMGVESMLEERQKKVDMEDVLSMLKVEKTVQAEGEHEQNTEDGESDETKINELIKHHSNDGKTDKQLLLQGMAKLLGARGGIKLSDNELDKVYSHFSSHYIEQDLPLPCLAEYSKEELERLHDDGMIQIPGVNEQRVEVTLDAEKFNQSMKETMSLLESICVRLESAIDRAERLNSITSEDESSANRPTVQTSEKINVESLRSYVKEALDDPELRALSRANAEAYVAAKAAENRERNRNVRR